MAEQGSGRRGGGLRATAAAALVALACGAAGGWVILGGLDQDEPVTSERRSQDGAGEDGGAPATSPSIEERESDAIATARLAAAQYDYAGAIEQLEQLRSPKAHRTLARVRAKSAKARAWKDNAQISHLFYHSLVIDPERAFTGPMAQGYRDYMVTKTELEAQLEQMHERGYVLVHPQQVAAEDADGTMAYTTITLPPGKKPFVLSIDDVSYYEYMDGAGFATDLFVDKDGRVRNHYTDAKGKTHVGAYDVSTVVDDFVEENPDFSYQGAKGTIALTGYNGVLGYRSSVREYGDTPETRAAIKEARTTATAMKKAGWKFASHTWGHLNATERPVGVLQADNERWQQEIAPITGKTDMLIFAFGADIGGASPYSPGNPKFDYFRRNGFRYFFPIDTSTPHWTQLEPSFYRQARINIDGITLNRSRESETVLHEFFDPVSTIDPAR